MARVLLVSLVFPPDGISTAQLLSDLVADLDARGHPVSVITTQPHYAPDPTAEAAQPLRRAYGGLFYRSEFRGIPVLHVPMGPKQRALSSRVWGWLRFNLMSLFAGLFLVERPDVILIPSPLLTGGVIGWLIGVVRGATFVYNAQDLHPDLAIKAGLLRNPFLIRSLYALERFVYARAGGITVIAEGMRRAVIAKGVPPERVHFIPNFVDLEVLTPGPRQNRFREECGVGEAFVVSYAGNMGVAQGLDVLLEAAAELREDPRIRFLFIGDGIHRKALEERSSTLGLRNVQFVPYQPFARMTEIYAASDLCVASLAPAMSSEAIPSKVLRIMACGRPVLALAAADSDLAHEVIAAGAGAVVSSDSAPEVARAIVALADAPERCAEAGRAGRAWVVDRYGRDVVIGRYEALFAGLADRRRSRGTGTSSAHRGEPDA